VVAYPSMPIICPFDDRIIEHPTGDFCSAHGVRWFVQCPACGAGWTTEPSGHYARASVSYVGRGQIGSDFCSSCGVPGPWLERPELIGWLRSQVKASGDIAASERLELLEILSKLEAMDANDTRTVTSWQRVRSAVPKVWEKAKPVRDALIGEAVKKALETLGL
jgi:hypothetical protein